MQKCCIVRLLSFGSPISSASIPRPLTPWGRFSSKVCSGGVWYHYYPQRRLIAAQHWSVDWLMTGVRWCWTRRHCHLNHYRLCESTATWNHHTNDRISCNNLVQILLFCGNQTRGSQSKIHHHKSTVDTRNHHSLIRSRAIIHRYQLCCHSYHRPLSFQRLLLWSRTYSQFGDQ